MVGTRACPGCGAEAADGAHFCHACGFSLRAPETCPACQTGVPAEASFCPGCGARLVGRRPESGAVEPSPEVAPSADVSAEARAQLDAAAQAARARSGGSNVLGNVLLFFGLLAVVLVGIRELNQGKAKEISPFEGGPAPSAAAPAPAADGSRSIAGTVRLPEGASPPAGATLFIVARIQGSAERGPPLAVKRVQAPSFPFRFVLGPGDVMLPDMPFDGPFDVSARLDADGNAMTKGPDDWATAAPAKAEVGAADLALELAPRTP